MCLVSWERTQKRDPHISLFWWNFWGRNGVPNGPFWATKSLVCCFFLPLSLASIREEKSKTPPPWRPPPFFLFPGLRLYGVYPSFQTYGVYPFPLFSQENGIHHSFFCSVTSGSGDRPRKEGSRGGGVYLGEAKLGVSKPGRFPLFSGKVQIVSRTLSGLFLVGALNRPRKRKRTSRENPRTIPEQIGKIPRKSGKSPKRTKKDVTHKKGRTSPDRETPPRLKHPRLAALDILF